MVGAVEEYSTASIGERMRLKSKKSIQSMKDRKIYSVQDS